MSDTNSRRPRRRPVDGLFGEESEIPTLTAPASRVAGPFEIDVAEAPRYIVEPPHAPLIVAPPPLPAAALIDRSTIAVSQFDVDSGTDVDRAESENDRVDLAAMPDEYNSLSSMIEALYETTTEEGKDSPKLTDYCLRLLRDARAALLKDDYAEAEYKAEQVRTRLLQALASAEAGKSLGVRVTWVWLFITGLISTAAILLPSYYQILPRELALRFSSQYLPYGGFLPAYVPIIRALSLGALGAGAVAIWNLSYFLRTRSYDPAYNGDYRLSPIKGAVIGGLFALLSGIGFVAAPGALGLPRLFGLFNTAYLLMYTGAFLGGMSNDFVFDFARGVLASLSRPPQRKRRSRVLQSS